MSIKKLLQQVDWVAVAPPTEQTDLPYATHTGTITLGGTKLTVYKLSNGRVLFGTDKPYDWN
ncbi:MAG: hypothetical protein GY861_02725 [bacterium]|nr:hypothetical protein [bacterium]